MNEVKGSGNKVPEMVRKSGYVAELARARVEKFLCDHCKGVTFVGQFFYFVRKADYPPPWNTHQDKVHIDCLPFFLKEKGSEKEKKRKGKGREGNRIE